MLSQAAFGWLGPDKDLIMVTNRTGSANAVGDVLKLDQRRTDADSTSNNVGVAASGLANVILVPTTPTSDWAAGIFGVVMAVALNDRPHPFLLRGKADTLRISGAVVLATVEQLVAPVTGTDDAAGRSATISTPVNTGAAAALPRKVIAIPLTAIGGAGTSDAWFDGINGFGTILSS